MKRKVVKLGPATLVISLPNKWTKKYGVKAGDEIEIEEKNQDLIVRNNDSDIQHKEVLDVTSLNHLLQRAVASKYLKGCDEIEVVFDTSKKSRTISRRVESMIGMEIIEQSKNKIIMKDMGSSETENFENILKRIVFLLHEISKETGEAIKNNESDLEYLSDMEQNINKFTDYCFRVLNKKGHFDTKKTAIYYCILYLMEELGDAYKKLINHLDKNANSIDKHLVNLYEDVHDLHHHLEKCLFKPSLEQSVHISKQFDKVSDTINHAVSNSKQPKKIITLTIYQEIASTIVKIMGQMLNLL